MPDVDEKSTATNSASASTKAINTNLTSTITGPTAGPAEIFRIRGLQPVSSLLSGYENQSGTLSTKAAAYTEQDLRKWEMKLPLVNAFAEFKHDLEHRHRASLTANEYEHFNRELRTYTKKELVPHPALINSMPDISVFSQPIDPILYAAKSPEGDALREKVKEQSKNFTSYILRYGDTVPVTVDDVQRLAVELSNITTKDALLCDQAWQSGWPQHYAARYKNYAGVQFADRMFALEEDKTGSILCSARWTALLEKQAKK